MNKNEFDDVINYLPVSIKKILLHINENMKCNTYEIRLRVNKPVVLSGSYGTVFVLPDSSLVQILTADAVCIDKNILNETVARLCDYSVYAHQSDIADGFVTFGGGHRAGFCGTAVYNNGIITSLRKIDSVNIRIARNVSFPIKRLFRGLSAESFNGILVAGPPCSGKTTFLKSFASECSSSFDTGYMKTVIIDERFELGEHIGVNCDIVSGMTKLHGIVHATRVLSPELIVCDEVCLEKEALEILSCCRTGVKFAVSVHSESQVSLFRRPVSEILLSSGFFDYIVFLDKKNISDNVRIYNTEEIKNECFCNDNDTL